MVSSELYVLLGSLMVVMSVLGLVGAQYARHWFFTPDPRTRLQPVEARSRQNRS